MIIHNATPLSPFHTSLGILIIVSIITYYFRSKVPGLQSEERAVKTHIAQGPFLEIVPMFYLDQPIPGKGYFLSSNVDFFL